MNIQLGLSGVLLLAAAFSALPPASDTLSFKVQDGTTLSRKRLADDPAVPGQPASSEVFIPLETGRKWYGDLQVKIRSGSREMEDVQLHEIVSEVGAPENVSIIRVDVGVRIEFAPPGLRLRARPAA